MKRNLLVVTMAFVLALPALFVSGAIAADKDRSLARSSVRHPIQNEQFYFVMPDRFENAKASNDTGGLEGGSTD